jgi:predicted CxxxxCH...CXXCH cytochrome family protein
VRRCLASPMLSVSTASMGWCRVLRGIALAAALLCGACLERRGEQTQEGGEHVTRCAACHGDRTRDGDYLLRAAPPVDLNKNTDPEYPGVGAHESHLTATDTHAAVRCEECHVVPKSADAAGHADSAGPAEVVFGALARAGDREPNYSASRRRCSDTWCHQGSEPNWTQPQSGDKSCDNCHGLPPPAPHPQAEDCSTCHGQVINQHGAFSHPERHVDGLVQYKPPDCQACHGDDDSPAPPADTAGNFETASVGVGAHRIHLSGTGRSRAMQCVECHVVPTRIEDAAHVDGLPAEVSLQGVAQTERRTPAWVRETRSCTDSWCHGPGSAGALSSPDWTATDTPLACDACHGAPPPLPHSPMTRCSVCHGEVIDDEGKILAPDLHVNGLVEVSVPTECTGCHGSNNGAPPTDIAGNSETRFAGVGAHQTHVLGTTTSRAVPCSECHDVPKEVAEKGHADTLLPAELHFSGVATQYQAPITYEAGTCKGSYCHGAVFFDGRLSGGTNTEPSWMKVDGTQSSCGTCHGLPPPRGHPQVSDCQSCHRNVRPDNVSFFDPSLHVNGITENYIP